MFRRSLLLGLVSGLLAGVASLIYQKVYTASIGGDFSAIVRPAGMFISSTLGCIVAAIGYWALYRLLKGKAEVVFNFLFVTLSFASILPAFATKLPLDVSSPELFPGLVVPMHFFPALAWFTIKPLFIKTVMPFRTALV